MRVAGIAFLLFVMVGCDSSDRVAKLEKENNELQKAQSERDRVADYDLRAKCAKEAKEWFNDNWSRDKDTILLDFLDHYNKKENKCFISTEYHYDSKLAGPDGSSWTNHISINDVQENGEYAEFSENHYAHYKPTITTSDQVLTCKVRGQKCSSLQEFEKLSAPLMHD